MMQWLQIRGCSMAGTVVASMAWTMVCLCGLDYVTVYAYFYAYLCLLLRYIHEPLKQGIMLPVTNSLGGCRFGLTPTNPRNG
jgi:hypothetical protein